MRHGFTRLQEPADQHGTPPHPTPSVDKDEDALHPPPPSQPSREMQVPQDPDEDPAPPPERTTPSPAPESEHEQEHKPTPPPALLRRSARDRRVPSHPRNIYGKDRHPVQQYKDVQRMRQWKDMVGDCESPVTTT